MVLISLRQLLDHAAEHSYGVPAFNVNNLEQIQVIMEAADETRSPVLLQASAGARKYAGESYLRHMVLVVLHQDHGASPAVCTQSLRSGFTSVMMDGSLKETRRLRLACRRNGSRSFASMVGTSRRPTEFRWRRSSAESAAACER